MLSSSVLAFRANGAAFERWGRKCRARLAGRLRRRRAPRRSSHAVARRARASLPASPRPPRPLPRVEPAREFAPLVAASRAGGSERRMAAPRGPGRVRNRRRPAAFSTPRASVGQVPRSARAGRRRCRDPRRRTQRAPPRPRVGSFRFLGDTGNLQASAASAATAGGFCHRGASSAELVAIDSQVPAVGCRPSQRTFSRCARRTSP